MEFDLTDFVAENYFDNTCANEMYDRTATHSANPQLIEDNEIMLFNEMGRYIQDDHLNGNSGKVVFIATSFVDTIPIQCRYLASPND